MIQTITIDIINDKALKLLQDLELLDLIRVHKEKSHGTVDWSIHHKGAMTKQSTEEIDNQLNDLRNGWEKNISETPIYAFITCNNSFHRELKNLSMIR